MKMMKFDFEKMKKVLSENDETMAGMSRRIGRTSSFIKNYSLSGNELPVYANKLICTELNIDENSFLLIEKRKPFRKYRYNLLLDDDLDAFLHKIAYEKRTSMTQYINDLLLREKEEYLKDGNTLEGWEH